LPDAAGGLHARGRSRAAGGPAEYARPHAADRPHARYCVAVMPGDGIGPEVIGEAEATLELAASLGGFAVSLERFDVGAGRHLAAGAAMAADLPERLAAFDAILTARARFWRK
jgi:isocitrate/isopropylmalate dehydrogenase